MTWNMFRQKVKPQTSSKLSPTSPSESSFENQPDSERAAEPTEPQNSKPQDEKKGYRPGMFDVWTMNMMTVLGGLMFGWPIALVVGFGGFLVAQTIMGLAFVILVYALSEIVSTTSFSGGSYGMARVMLGFYPGFLIACFELMEYMSYSADSAEFVATFLAEKLSLDVIYLPFIGFIFYVLCYLLILERNYIYWRVVSFIGIFSLIVLLIYCIGSLPFTHFAENASMHVHDSVDSAGDPVTTDDATLTPLTRNWFRGGMVMFLQVLPYTTWGFAGIESGALVTDIIDQPRKNLPAGMISGLFTLFVLFIIVNFVASSMHPGVSSIFRDDDESFLVNEYFMNYGLGRIGIPPEVSEWLVLPAEIGMSFSFMLPAAKLYHAMVESKLFTTSFTSTPPPPSDNESNKVETPPEAEWISAAVTMTISYGLFLVAIFFPDFDITNTPIMLACIVYLSDLFAYYKLQTDFDIIDREFKSPFGIIGAIFAAVIFLLCFIGLIAFMGEIQLPLFLIVYWLVCSIYYFFYAAKRQVISRAEEQSIFTMHVIRFNRHKRQRVTKRKPKKTGFQKFLSYFNQST
eukprot:gene7349-7930_t